MVSTLRSNCGPIGIVVVAGAACVGLLAQTILVTAAHEAAEVYGRCLAESNATDVACKALSTMLVTERSGIFAITGIVGAITLGTWIAVRVYSRSVRPVQI